MEILIQKDENITSAEDYVEIITEGNLLRLFFDFKYANIVIDNETCEVANNLYYCYNVDVHGGRTYNAIVSAIVNDKYSIDDVQAIMANIDEARDETNDLVSEKRAEYIIEYEAYQQWRKRAKEIATIVLEQLNSEEG